MHKHGSPAYDPARSSPALLDKRDVAHLLGISPATVDRMVARGEIEAVRIGPVLVRFRPADVDALIEARTGPAPSTAAAKSGDN